VPPTLNSATVWPSTWTRLAVPGRSSARPATRVQCTSGRRDWLAALSPWARTSSGRFSPGLLVCDPRSCARINVHLATHLARRRTMGAPSSAPLPPPKAKHSRTAEAIPKVSTRKLETSRLRRRLAHEETSGFSKDSHGAPGFQIMPLATRRPCPGTFLAS
jgi:hypothetical protein